MVVSHFNRLGKRLFKAADTLRAGSNFASNEYFLPVMGLIFLRHAYSRFLAAKAEIEPTLPSRGGKTRALTKEDFSARRAIFLQPSAQFDALVALPDGEDKAAAIVAAMESIEADYASLQGILPKSEYNELDNDVIGQLLRIFDDPELRNAEGDVFGRIYEYFLTKFAGQKAHDNGEFFTPISIVQTLVNVIEPGSGKILDPACGSGGMFVQSAHFIEDDLDANPAERVTFYGMEKNQTTVRLAKMNLAVHGLEGDIQKSISYYEDPHDLVGKADFVMANPPFNVDEIDAEKVKGDPRLPFGLPGVNKKKKVSNGNYVWMSFCHAYLSETGRAGIVMSSQASSAGKTERDVREQMVRSGDVDVMIAIGSNFFYTRTVPCELWFFDKGKPEDRRDHVLLIDARPVFRQVDRRVRDFSPEQLANLTSIVWLYRGETDRFLDLVESHQSDMLEEAAVSDTPVTYFGDALLRHANELPNADELVDQAKAYQRAADDLTAQRKELSEVWDDLPSDIAGLTQANAELRNLAEAAGDLVKRGNRTHKALRTHADSLDDAQSSLRALKAMDALKADANGHLKRIGYFHRQSDWLLSRFPEAELRDVEGLVKLASRAEIEAQDWSLTPGRYVGVAPEEEDPDFDFEEAMGEIREELADLTDKASELYATIDATLAELT